MDSAQQIDNSQSPLKRSRSPSDRGSGRGNSRGRGRGGGRNKKSDMGRTEWSQIPGDRRSRNDQVREAAKRRKLTEHNGEKPVYAVEFSKEEIDQEERRPKRKVAVMIGYSGSGYKGMQLNHNEKTIEGDLFAAFVAAGAVSKANADDPKKSSLVRCARTDKGVHAAGNIISMKLIIEDKDIIQKINENLSPQIRVWGMERTNGSFNAYQLCDSRIYEYLIPTYCFLPPHPESFLGKKLVELADRAEDREGFDKRQQEVSTFWSEVEEQQIKPILDRMDPSTRESLIKVLFNLEQSHQEGKSQIEKVSAESNTQPLTEPNIASTMTLDEMLSETAIGTAALTSSSLSGVPSTNSGSLRPDDGDYIAEVKEPSALEIAIKELKAQYIKAKKAYRIHPDRLERVRSTLSRFLGTRNFYNYTIQKTFRDASAKRLIKSFIVNDKPVIINDTEWLSLKVHGQSFMMHQIRKMVSMMALVVRCGCHEGRIQDSYMADRFIIPKAPSLGLLLERPVFETYNQRLGEPSDRLPIEFTKYEKEMEEFKQREIYERIFREEERENQFHTFFATQDNLQTSQLLYLSSMGIVATKENARDGAKVESAEVVVDGASSEDDANPEDG